MDRWLHVAEVEALAPGEGVSVPGGPVQLAVFHDGGEFFAIDDACPHQGASLATGTLHEGRVICPRHSWVFDLRTGHCPRETHEPVMTYETRCRDGLVEVLLPGDGRCE
jgi:NAD(P)H-dependent nitrite reductase small subunit